MWLLNGSIEVTHCSLDLGEHHYGSCFNSLSGNSFTSILLRSIPEDLSCSFFWNIVSGSPLSSILCVGVCTLDNVGTSLSLHRSVLCRKRSPPISLARDSGGLSNVFYPQEEAACFLAVIFVFSLCAELKGACRGSSGIYQPKLHLYSPQLVRLC